MAAEQVSAKLDSLAREHDIGGYDSPSRYLPSRATQQARRASLPEESILRTRVHTAADAAGLNATALEPFIADVAAARRAPLLDRHGLDGTTLATGVDSLLVRLGSSWTALLPLRASGKEPGADLDATPLRAALAQLSVPGVTISALNLKEEADALYGQYLHSAIRLCCAGLAAIALLLCVALHSFTRAGLVLLPLGLAALSVASGFALSHHPMNLLHLIGLLLIFAVGSNYALFFDRGAIQKGRADRRTDTKLAAPCQSDHHHCLWRLGDIVGSSARCTGEYGRAGCVPGVGFLRHDGWHPQLTPPQASPMRVELAQRDAGACGQIAHRTDSGRLPGAGGFPERRISGGRA